MAIVQPALFVPEDIAARLLTGEFVRDGSVVRDLAGRFVKHLPEVQRPADTQEGALRSIAKALTNPKSTAIGLGAVAVVATAGCVVFLVAGKRKQGIEPEMPKCVEKFNASLGAYLEAVRNGCLDADVLDRLISDLDAVKDESDSGRIVVGFSADQLDMLVNHVADYTRKLAESNQIKLSELQESGPHSEDNSPSRTIIDLRRYLGVQEQIFNRSA
jgi:signal transduction histidine kinase